MRVVSLPYSLNGESGLVCIPVGDRESLEKIDINSLMLKANPLSNRTINLVYAHLSPVTPRGLRSDV